MSVELINRPTWAEIDLNRLAFNFESVKSFIGKPLEYMAVVKADGYGHGAIECARKLQKVGIDWFGVALPEEGLELRNNGITSPILCLGGFWEGQESFVLDNQLTPVLYQTNALTLFDNAARNRNLKVPVHIKIDTGMGRIGVVPAEVSGFIEVLKGCGNLRVEGIMTHFASADDLRETDFTMGQIKRFWEIVKIFRQNGFSPKYLDMANSPGAIAHEASRSNLVRLGGILYGLGRDVLPAEIDIPKLKPVMSVKTRITHLKNVGSGETLGYGRTFTARRPSRIATIPIGYQDGFVRALSNKGQVIVSDQFAPIAGRISMDWTMIDVTDHPSVNLGDEVILVGKSNSLNITAEDLAMATGTISYEITCGINRRVRRVYLGVN